MRNYPKVSIIIPTKNEEKNIVRCLKSIKKQNYPGKIEIIVVDNYSEDNTVKLARTCTGKVLTHGFERSAQRNFGAKKAYGGYLLFIDADMELKQGAISKCVSLMLDKSLITNNKSRIITLKERSRGSSFWGKALALEKNCYQDETILAGARFFKKSDFLALGGYDESLIAAEDWDLTERAKKIGLSILFTQNVLIYHHESKDSLLKLLKQDLHYIKNIALYAKKHPKKFSQQSSLSFRLTIFAKNWHKLFLHPILTLAFFLYKTLVWILWRYEKN